MDRHHVYRSPVLDHRGLVAGMCEALGMGDVVDQATQHNPEMRLVTAGHAVTAMVRNGLGVVHPPRELVPRCFQDQPLARLLAPGVLEATPRNDAALGRAFETLDADGVTARSRLRAATAAERWGLAPRVVPRDRPSFPVDGRDHSDHAPDAQVVPSTRGYSRDHRPDRKHVLLAVMVEHHAGIPVRLKPLRGQSRDAPAFGQVVQAPMAPWHTTDGTTALVAAGALEREANRQQRSGPRRPWITRVPAPVSAAPAALAPPDPPTMAPLRDGERDRVLTSTDGGVAPRGRLVCSEPRPSQAQRPVDQPRRKRREQDVNAVQQRGRLAGAGAVDAPQALSIFAHG
jgi:hypothetical protein